MLHAFWVALFSFSRLLRLKGLCIRIKEHPLGTGTNPKEVLGNALLQFTYDMCILLWRRGCWFSIENPADSHLFRYAPVVKMMRVSSASFVVRASAALLFISCVQFMCVCVSQSGIKVIVE